MEKKYTLTLDKEFIQFCELNKITDINKKATETFNRGFSLLKYGETPNGATNIKERIVEKIIEIPVEIIKEKIVEKIVEVPIEVIKEIRVEVPVEVIKEVLVKGDTKVVTKEIIKEVPVERVIFDTSKETAKDKEIESLKNENDKLKSELDNITSSLNKFNKGTFMKNSDLGSLYSE